MWAEITSREVLIYLGDKLVGPLLWGLLVLLIAHLLFLVRYKKTRSFLEDSWFCYHWTVRDNKPQIVQSSLCFKCNPASVRRMLIADISQNGTSLLYSGSVTEEGGHLIIHFESKDHEEHTYIRLPMPLKSKSEVITGIWMGFDHDKHIAAGAIMLSRTEQPIQFVRALLLEKFEVENSIALLRIK